MIALRFASESTGHNRKAASEAMFITQPGMDALRCMPLFLDNPFVVFQDLVNDPNERIKLRPRRRSLSSVSWRNRVLQDLRNGLAVYPKMLRRCSSTHSSNVAGPANSPI